MNRYIRAGLVSSAILLLQLSPRVLYAQGSAPWVHESLDGLPCQGRQGVGPFDYMNRINMMGDLNIVEEYHFKPSVEQLSGTTKSLAQNLDYTLRAWPNHHRALNAMMRFQLRETDETPLKLAALGIPPAECYFYRAMNYSPKDANARMLLAMYLHRKGELDLAYTRYQEARSLAPYDIQLKYNLALLLLEMEQYDQAKKLATEVYAADYPLLGLQRKLERAGYWE